MGQLKVRVRPATRNDIPKIVWISNSSIPPREDIGFGGGLGSPFVDASKLGSAWQDPNLVQGHQIMVGEIIGRGVVGYTTIEERGSDLELVDIDVPMELQGQGIGTGIVRAIEEKARRAGKRAITLGTSRNAEGKAWKSLPWWQHQGYQITGEEENEWTRSIGPKAREIRMRKNLD